MEITLKTIFDSQNSLNKLVTLDMPIKTSHKFVRLLRQLQEELKIINEFREKIITKYGEPDDKSPNVIKVKDEYINQYITEFEDFLKATINVDFEKINIDELGDIKLSISDMSVLESFLKTD